MAQAGTVTYVYTDTQGTPVMESDAQGNITAQLDYTPYGTQALGSPPDGPGYTGHVNDPDTGLVYMQARYYDPEVGSFLSLDPVGPTPGDLFAFNRYAYADNNPVMRTDPTGMQSDDICMGNMQCISERSQGSGNIGNKNIIPFYSYTNNFPSKEDQKEDKIPSKFMPVNKYPNPYCNDCSDIYVYQLTNVYGVALNGSKYYVEENIVKSYSTPGVNLNGLTSMGKFVSLDYSGKAYDNVGLTEVGYLSLDIDSAWRARYIQTFKVKWNNQVYSLSTVMAHDIIVNKFKEVKTTTIVLKQ